MAIISGTWLDTEGRPFIPNTRTVPDGPQGYTAAAIRLRPKPPKSARHRYAMKCLGWTAQIWAETLTAAERLKWGSLTKTVDNRARQNSDVYPHQHYMQVQMPLLYTNQNTEDPGIARQRWLFRNWYVDVADADSQLIRLGWQMRQQFDISHRSVVHIHQVPPHMIGNPSAWRYARWLVSYDYTLDFLNTDWQDQQELATACFPFVAGDTVMLYVRVTDLENTDPPYSIIQSELSTEDWTALSVVAT